MTLRRLLVLTCLLATLLAAHAAAASGPPLALTLSTHTGKSGALHLRVSNRGKTDVTVIRPRAKMLDHFEEWGGWRIEVSGPHGRAMPFPFPSAVPPVTALDLVTLRPGESIGVEINLSHWLVDRTAAHSASVADTPGNYSVIVRYHFAQGWLPGEHGTADKVVVPELPVAESRTQSFTIAR
jgi:hypothetical protein